MSTDNSEIQDEFLSYFTNIYGQSNYQMSGNLQVTPNFLGMSIIIEEQATTLIKPVTYDDVKAIIFRIDGNKAPRPDDFCASFYKSAWSIVDVEVVSAIENFFTVGKMLKQCNATILTHVP